jgi:hypothetical protein
LGRRQLVSRLEEAELQCLMDLMNQLEICGHARTRVELKLDHNSPFTNWLVEKYHHHRSVEGVAVVVT